MRRSSLAAALAAFAFLPCCIFVDWDDWDDWGRYQAEATETIAISVESLDGFSCRTHNGSVTLIGKPAAQEIVVVARKRARGRSQEAADANLLAMELTQEVRGGQLELSWEWSEPKTRSRSASVSYRIEAPPQLVAEILTHNGTLSVTGWQGNLRGETHNGEVDIQGEVTDVELITHNGSITARLEGSGTLNGNIETHNGEVDVEVGEGISARIVASTDNGGVSYRGRLARVESGRNFLVGDMGTGDGRLRIRTHNGAVTIR
jgi:hypothetical protein